MDTEDKASAAEAARLMIEATERRLLFRSIEKSLASVSMSAQAAPTIALHRLNLILTHLAREEDLHRWDVEEIFDDATQNSLDAEENPTAVTAIIDHLWDLIVGELLPPDDDSDDEGSQDEGE